MESSFQDEDGSDSSFINEDSEDETRKDTRLKKEELRKLRNLLIFFMCPSSESPACIVKSKESWKIRWPSRTCETVEQQKKSIFSDSNFETFLETETSNLISESELTPGNSFGISNGDLPLVWSSLESSKNANSSTHGALYNGSRSSVVILTTSLSSASLPPLEFYKNEETSPQIRCLKEQLSSWISAVWNRRNLNCALFSGYTFQFLCSLWCDEVYQFLSELIDSLLELRCYGMENRNHLLLSKKRNSLSRIPSIRINETNERKTESEGDWMTVLRAAAKLPIPSRLIERVQTRMKFLLKNGDDSTTKETFS